MRAHALALASAVVIAHTGCAAPMHNAVKDEESLLIAAGFEARSVDSPQARACLASMPLRRLVLHGSDDQGRRCRGPCAGRGRSASAIPEDPRSGRPDPCASSPAGSSA